MKLTQSQLRTIIREELNEIKEIPDDDAPASEDELDMEALTAEYEKAARRSWFRTASVVDPFSGEKMDLDSFLSLLSNRVISKEVTREVAAQVVNNIEGYLA